MPDRRTPISFAITPTGKALGDAVRSAADGRILLVRVAATSEDFVFQFTSDALAFADPSASQSPETLSSRELLDRVVGPYCVGCRKSATAVDFTDWTTSERRDEIIAAACPSCGRARCSAGSSTELLRRAALAALIAAAKSA